MGRLDPAESGEEGGGTIEGKGTSFYFHQGQTPDIIYPRTPRIQGGESIFRSEAGRIIGITSEFIRILEILMMTSTHHSLDRLSWDFSIRVFYVKTE